MPNAAGGKHHQFMAETALQITLSDFRQDVAVVVEHASVSITSQASDPRIPSDEADKATAQAILSLSKAGVMAKSILAQEIRSAGRRSTITCAKPTRVKPSRPAPR